VAGGGEEYVNAWGWSDEGQAMAQAHAQSRLTRLLQHVASKGYEGIGHYGYGDRVLREPVLEELPGAAITRNSYGCEVLNTARVMFVDIDLPEPEKPGLMGKLFGAKPAPDPAEAALAKVEAWLKRNGDWGFRAYRTKAGLRLLATHAPVEPAAGLAIMAELSADPMYVRLCKAQESYRARLSPKPWRCDAGRAPSRWPFATPAEEGHFKDWLGGYQEKAKVFSTCSFLRQLGNPATHADAAAIVDLHDRRAVGARPLA
jgi:hypothetical protein